MRKLLKEDLEDLNEKMQEQIVNLHRKNKEHGDESDRNDDRGFGKKRDRKINKSSRKTEKS